VNRLKIEPQVYTLIWDDGFLLKGENKSSQSNILLFIDEESKYMRLTYPSTTDLITRRNLERQVRQIQKRGFFLENKNSRIGRDFDYQMEEERETISSTPKVDQVEKIQGIAESIDIPRLEQLMRDIKQIWVHQRIGEGSDMTDSLENGQPSYFVSFLTSNYQKLNILISSLPDRLS
jgi:hypothetical protein